MDASERDGRKPGLWPWYLPRSPLGSSHKLLETLKTSFMNEVPSKTRAVFMASHWSDTHRKCVWSESSGMKVTRGSVPLSPKCTTGHQAGLPRSTLVLASKQPFCTAKGPAENLEGPCLSSKQPHFLCYVLQLQKIFYLAKESSGYKT